MQDRKIQDIYNSYFHFNNQRTLSTGLPSELLATDTQQCSIFVDKTRQFDNQIIIHDACQQEKLEAYLGLFENSFSPEVSVEPLAKTLELEMWLSSQGFKPVLQHEFLELRSSNYVPKQHVSESISIERWEQDQADDFLTLLKTSGLTCADDIWEKKRALYCSDTFRCYVAKINGEPCAWATSFIEGEYAILANAYTQEHYRSKGCQTALLRARIDEAISLGVQVILTDVMPNSTSSKNCQSLGFISAGIRDVWCKD